MAPDRGGSTAILDPVPDRGWPTAILDPIPNTGTLTAIIDGDKQILACTTCMGAVVKADEGGLVICIPISKHATSSSTNNSTRTVYKKILSNQTEEEMAPAVFSVRGSARTPQLQSMTKTTQKFGVGISVASTTHGDTPGVVHDSACSQAKVNHHSTTVGQSYSTPCIPQCTDIDGRRTRPRQTIVESKEASGTCKYVNIQQYNVKQNFSKRDAYHDEFGVRTENSWRNYTDSDVWYSSEASHTHLSCHTPLGKGEAPVGNLSNWLRAVKPEVECPASLVAEESWPPLLDCRKKGETSGSHGKYTSTSYTGMEDRIKPVFAANYEHRDVVLLSNMENQSNSHTASPHVKPEVALDEQSWPSLEKSCKQSVLHDDYGSDKKRTLRPLVSSNFHHHPGAPHTMQDQRQHSTPRGSFHKTENMHFPPLLLMLNKDFIVTSPLKQNLLLTLALMGRRSDVETPENFQGQTTEGETKRQILVGQFKAFSSFLNFVLGRDATRVRTESNAGGTSTISESLSVEYFVRRFQAKDIVTEMEVEYRSFNWKKVDYICTLYGQRVGVSVTRAMSFPDPKDFSAQMAYRLLYKKLFGLVVARHGVSKRHSFSQCILHIWCETQQTATIMQREYDGVSHELDIADDVVMVLTVADGCHARPIFYESLLRNA